MANTVASAEEIQPGERKFFSIDGTEIAVLNVDGEYFAIRNSCPHMEGPVGRGPIEMTPEGIRISCPFHNWTFDLSTGKTLFQSKRLQTYDVSVEDGDVVVDL